MNVIHMKYAVEVAKAGSINKASEVLLVAQPNLSRSIKELEADLGITIFSRTSKGMMLTPEGEEFMGYAKTILRQLDEIETMYKTGHHAKQTFSISVPRASYIADAFARFSNFIDKGSAEIYYHETNSYRAIKNILENNYNLGIIRYAACFDSYFKSLLDEKGLDYELVAEFKYVLVMNGRHPLAQKEEIHYEDLEPYIEISHADPYVPSLPANAVLKEERSVNCSRQIYVFERGGQFNLLAQNPETFMWVSPVPDYLISNSNLVQRECPDNRKIYRDMLIRRKDYRLTPLDKQFVTELCNSKRKYL
ncbi:MAG: LysR family transcriptional regulator [Blautia sp.]|nr:LysR family transcriptional regulator [Blautia sp.]